MSEKNLASRDSAMAESNTVNLFERLLKDPTVDVAKLEKMMELQERMQAKSAEAAFAAAFSLMQGEIPTITERGEIKVGNEIRSRYARYEDMDKVLKPILQKHGFALTFKTEFTDKAVKVSGILMHSGGHREQTHFLSPADTSGSKNAIQALGSTISYGQRYCTKTLLNISTGGLDNDGGSGGQDLITEKQELALIDLIDDVRGEVPQPKFIHSLCKHLKIGSLSELPAVAYKDAELAIESKRAK